MVITTERLTLRPFCEADRAINAQIFADPLVRRFAVQTLSAQQADARIDQSLAQLSRSGIGMLAVEHRRDGSFIGMLGLTSFGPALMAAIPSRPKLQIAWQLASRVWGEGLATEGALAMLNYAWHNLDAPEVVAITAAINLPSRRVAEKAGMSYQAEEEFLHPDIPDTHILKPHVLYRAKRP